MSTVGVPLKLSTTSPDFDSLVLQLQLFLDSKGTWEDLLPSSLGQTLIEMMSSVGAFNQFAIESAFREAFLTAKRESSIYAICRMLGVRITRKSPASVSVNLRRQDATVQHLIPRYTQFMVGDKPMYNREAIVFPAGVIQVGQLHQFDTAAPISLYEGTVKKKTFSADTTQFREIYLDEPGFRVSDTDVLVHIVNKPLLVNEEWYRTRSGNAIWTAEPDEKVYYDSSSGLGDCILTFGDGARGALAPLGSNIEVTYALTNGALGNYGVSQLKVAQVEDGNIEGTTVTIISNGSDEKPALFYRSMAPHIHKARSRSVTSRDFQAITLHYPSVASCAVSAQRTSAYRASNPRWMNITQMCMLPPKPPALAMIPSELDYTYTEAQKDDYRAYMQEFQHSAIWIDIKDAYKHLVDLELTLYIHKAASASEVLPVVANRVRSLFDRTDNTLGRKLTQSDVTDACLVEEVDYVTISVMKFSTSLGDTKSDLIPLDPNVTDPSASIHLRSMSAFLELNDTPSTFRINAQYTDRI